MEHLVEEGRIEPRLGDCPRLGVVRRRRPLTRRRGQVEPEERSGRRDAGPQAAIADGLAQRRAEPSRPIDQGDVVIVGDLAEDCQPGCRGQRVPRKGSCLIHGSHRGQGLEQGR